MTSMTSTALEKTFFVTGFPGFIGKRLVRLLSARYPGARIYALTESRFQKDAERIIERLQNPRITAITGNIVDMHLGLSGEEYQTLCAQDFQP
jgi:thioester reductase-like protein